jgi:hypothetical protein
MRRHHVNRSTAVADRMQEHLGVRDPAVSADPGLERQGGHGRAAVSVVARTGTIR